MIIIAPYAFLLFIIAMIMASAKGYYQALIIMLMIPYVTEVWVCVAVILVALASAAFGHITAAER